MRLQVFLSRAGVCSRRSAVSIIRSGIVQVNGKKILEPSFKVKPEKDAVLFNGKKLLPREKLYLILNKPKGVTTTKKDPFAEKTVMDILPRSLSHLNPAGRLDRDTEGLLLLTNDGSLLDRLTHPRYNVEKIYVARIDKRLMYADKAALEKGISLGRERTAPCKIRPLKKNIIELTLREGRKRQIKRMLFKVGYKVLDLKRVKEGFLDLGDLKEGGWRFLTKKEVSLLHKKYLQTPLD